MILLVFVVVCFCLFFVLLVRLFVCLFVCLLFVVVLVVVLYPLPSFINACSCHQQFGHVPKRQYYPPR